jgi:hypothetical protein
VNAPEVVVLWLVVAGGGSSSLGGVKLYLQGNRVRRLAEEEFTAKLALVAAKSARIVAVNFILVAEAIGS